MKGFPALALTCLLLLPARLARGEWTADIGDMDYAPPRFVAVDKKAQSMALLTRQSPLREVAAIPCATGQELGDKFKEGDLKTPEGVYFITTRRNSGLNYDLYGDLAFPLDFPNPVDVLKGKSGHGIWIHGRGHAIIPFETQGCVALNVPDIHRMDSELALGMPVIIADEVRVGQGASPELGEEAREVVAATNAWAKAWQEKSEAFFDFHDPEKFAITEGRPFATFRSHKERLFRTLPWIRVTLSDVHAIHGPDYWVTYFVQVYQSPRLISQGIKRLYWQKGNGRWRIVGMEYAEMPTALAAKGPGRTVQTAEAAAEADTEVRKTDSVSEEEQQQARQLVDAQQPVVERMAQKAFHTLNLTRRPTPEDEAILEVAETGPRKGAAVTVTDAVPQAPSPPALLKPSPAHATPAAPRVLAALADAPVPAHAAGTPAAPPAAVSPPPMGTTVAHAASVPAAASPAPKAPAAPAAQAPSPAALSERAAAAAALVEAWRAAWEKGDLDAYMHFYADDATQGNLRGKAAIRAQKAGLWRGLEPDKVRLSGITVTPSGDTFRVVCALDYQAAGRRPSKGYKTLIVAPAGADFRILSEKWSRNAPPAEPGTAPVTVTAKAAPGETPAPAQPSPDDQAILDVAGAASAKLPAPPSPPTATASSPSNAATPPAPPMTSPPPVVGQASAPAPVQTPTPAKAEAKPTVKPADRAAEAAAMLEAWRTAWERGDLDAYAGFYTDRAVQGGRKGRSAIRDQKKILWQAKAPQRVVLGDMRIRPHGNGFEVTCRQEYEDRDGGKDRGRKTLILVPSGSGFAIADERWSRL